MGWYTRQQVALLLLTLGAAGVGLGVVHWRAAHPALVEGLEQLEREIAASREVSADEPRPERGSEPGPSTSRDPEPRESRPPASTRPAKRQLSSSGETAAPMDLNRATLADLTQLPGVGLVLARRILDARADAGRFGEVDDLLAVRGVGRAKLERLRPFVGILDSP